MPLSIHRRYVIPLDTYAALVNTVASRRLHPVTMTEGYPAILRATRDFSPYYLSRKRVAAIAEILNPVLF
jgi:hypothetical protein